MTTVPSVVLLPQPALRLKSVLEVAAPHKIAPATADDLLETQALAARLMDHKVAALETYLAVMAVQPAALLIHKEEGRVTGVVGMLFLRRSGVNQILRGRFNATEVDVDLLTPEGESPVAIYTWGVAAATKPAGTAILVGGSTVRQVLFPTISSFTKAVTGAGRHVAVDRYGFRPLRHAQDDLLVREPKWPAEQAA
jgi:hypothetical protein